MFGQDQVADVAYLNGLLTKLEAAAQKVGVGENKNKVLVIGQSGVGKSTFLNYANGTRYKMGSDEWNFPVLKYASGSKEIAEVGQELMSKTLVPQVIDHAQHDWSYCDLAGLHENRGPDEKIIASVSTQLLSKTKGQIKGILVVCDIDSFSVAGKGERFKQTLKDVQEIVGNNSGWLQSVCFLITKAADTVTREGILRDYIQPLLVAQKRDIELSQVLSFIKANPDKIVIPNVCDNGKSLVAIEAALNELPPNSNLAFNFLTHDEVVDNFQISLINIGQKWLSLSKEIDITLPKKILALKAEKEELGRDIVHSEQASTEAKVRIKKLANIMKKEMKAAQKKFDKSAKSSNDHGELTLALAQHKANFDVAEAPLKITAEVLDEKIIQARQKIETAIKQLAEAENKLSQYKREFEASQPLFLVVSKLAKLLDIEALKSFIAQYRFRDVSLRSSENVNPVTLFFHREKKSVPVFTPSLTSSAAANAKVVHERKGLRTDWIKNN